MDFVVSAAQKKVDLYIFGVLGAGCSTKAGAPMLGQRPVFTAPKSHLKGDALKRLRWSKTCGKRVKKGPRKCPRSTLRAFCCYRARPRLDPLFTIPNPLWASAGSSFCPCCASHDTLGARAATPMQKTLQKMCLWAQNDPEIRSNMSSKSKRKSLSRLPEELRDSAGGPRVPRASLVDFGAAISFQIEAIRQLFGSKLSHVGSV